MTELIKEYYDAPIGTYLNQSVLINNVTLDCDIYRVESETVLTPSVFAGCTAVDANTQIVIGRNMSVASGTTLTPPYRCKGIVIGDVGTFTNEGTISMTARGASGVGKNIQLTEDYMISAVGGTGGAGGSGLTTGNAGSSPSSGVLSCGGGGSGASRATVAGSGGAGTSFSGGAGSGGSSGANSSDGSSTGGAGSDGAVSSSGQSYTCTAGGGAGNPQGSGNTTASVTWQGNGNGTGGLIVLIADTIKQTGSLVSEGVQAQYSGTALAAQAYHCMGGSSGGGCIVLISKTNSITGTNSVAGGASATAPSETYARAGGAGGAGAYAAYIVEDLILVNLPVEFVITDIEHVDNIDPSEAVRFIAEMDEDELQYDIMGKRHYASTGHHIQDEEGTALTKRKALAINSPLTVEDDSANEKTDLGVDTDVDLSVIHAPGTRTPDEFEVAITDPQEGQVMKYNATTEQWENGDIGNSVSGVTAYMSNKTKSVTGSVVDVNIRRISGDLVLFSCSANVSAAANSNHFNDCSVTFNGISLLGYSIRAWVTGDAQSYLAYNATFSDFYVYSQATSGTLTFNSAIFGYGLLT